MNSPLRPVYEVLASDIHRLGVRQVFGLMSDDTALLVTTLDALGVRFRGARHETNALAMADGFASATREVAFGIIGRGPATANALLGAMQALRSGSRVLLVFAESPNRLPEPNGLGPEQKAFHPTGVLQAAGFRVFTANEPGSSRQVLAEAWQAAHRGAVALMLPMNVQHALIDPVATDPGPCAAPVQNPPAPREAAIGAARALLAQARRPLILAGVGAHHAGARDAIVRLADHLGAALATTLKAQDMFRGHPANSGMLGTFSHGGGPRLIQQADCVIAFGAGLNHRTTSFGHALPAGVPLIQVDAVRSNIGRWFPVDVAIVADARRAAEHLLEALPERPLSEQPLRAPEVLQKLAAFRLDSEFEAAPTPRTLDPRALALALDAILPRERNVVYDVGNFLQVAALVSVPSPAHVKHSLDFASIGLGFGTALGFACGAPDRPTVLFIGDGGFLMSMGELETVAREDIPLVIVLMNDCAYGAELHYLGSRSMPVALSKFPDVDFEPVAAAFGFTAATVRTLDELRALAPMLRAPEGPIFLDCKINGAIAAPFLLENLAQEATRR
jgi:thiamine pyrophosphate-dependent acetolactate synthase large subunit-like protein